VIIYTHTFVHNYPSFAGFDKTRTFDLIPHNLLVLNDIQ